jgi:hypothetical protein
MNIADCEEREGKPIEALRHFKVTAESLAPGDERIAIALRRVAALEARLPHLVVRVVQGRNDTTVMLSGEGGGRIGKSDYDKPIPVAPGSYTVTLYVRGGTHEERVTLAEGETKEVLLDATTIEREQYEDERARERASAEQQRQIQAQIAANQASAQASIKAAMEQANSAQQDARQRVNMGLALGGGLGCGIPGLAFLTIGIVQGVNTLSYKTTVDEHCAGKWCDQEGMDAARKGEQSAIMGPVFIAVGAPLTALGVYFVVKGFSRPTAVSVQSTRGGPGVFVTHTF